MKKNDLNAKPDASMSNNLMKIFLFEDRPGGGSRTQPVVITQAPQKQGPFIRKMMNVYQSPQNADLELGCDVLKDDKICSQKVEEEIKENIWEENDEESLREVMVVENLDSDDDYLDSKKVDKNSLDKKSPTLE